MDVEGLHGEWDASMEVRNMVRRAQKLFVHPPTQKWCEPTRANCVENSAVLSVALKRLANTALWKMPHLEPLQVEISMLFQRLGVCAETKTIYTCAVETKKLLGFIKRRARRCEVTKAGLCLAEAYPQPCFLVRASRL